MEHQEHNRKVSYLKPACGNFTEMEVLRSIVGIFENLFQNKVDIKSDFVIFKELAEKIGGQQEDIVYKAMISACERCINLESE